MRSHYTYQIAIKKIMPTANGDNDKEKQYNSKIIDENQKCWNYVRKQSGSFLLTGKLP